MFNCRVRYVFINIKPPFMWRKGSMIRQVTSCDRLSYLNKLKSPHLYSQTVDFLHTLASHHSGMTRQDITVLPPPFPMGPYLLVTVHIFWNVNILFLISFVVSRFEHFGWRWHEIFVSGLLLLLLRLPSVVVYHIEQFLLSHRMTDALTYTYATQNIIPFSTMSEINS